MPRRKIWEEQVKSISKHIRHMFFFSMFKEIYIDFCLLGKRYIEMNYVMTYSM